MCDGKCRFGECMSCDQFRQVYSSLHLKNARIADYYQEEPFSLTPKTFSTRKQIELENLGETERDYMPDDDEYLDVD